MSHWNHKCQPPWSVEEIETKVANAYAYAQTAPGSKTPQADFDELPDYEKPKKDPVAIKPFDALAIIKKGPIFKNVYFEPKQCYLDPWVESEGTSMIFGGSGLGKTWFALSVLKAICTGQDLGPWAFVQSAPVLYLDAEMTGVDVQERMAMLKLDSQENFHVYSDADAYRMGYPKANILSEKWREAIKDALIALNVKVWCADNLMSLMPGADENKKEEWDPINQWFLQLRYLGITTSFTSSYWKIG